MSIINLSVYQLKDIAPVQAAEQLKLLVPQFIRFDLQETLYLTSGNNEQELVVLSRWPDLRALADATSQFRENKLYQPVPGISLDVQRAYNFRVVKEFQRFHLAAQTTSVLLYRLVNTHTNIDKVIESAKQHDAANLFSFSGLVHYWLGVSLNNQQPLVLMRNDWLSEEARQLYLGNKGESHREWVKKAGLEFLQQASTLVSAFNSPFVPPKGTSFIE
ncbi:MAG TPA: hypothetical protein VH186_32490 [Chloroflexia bacterium]|nr:hypothetical protein [Chloroflexia bacterium]